MTRPAADDYDAVTARDITDFLHHLAELRYGQPCADDPAERAAFLARRAKLFTWIADSHASTDPDYARQIRQIALDARAAADQAALRLPRQRVGPNQRRTDHTEATPGGARSQENSGATSGDLAHIS